MDAVVGLAHVGEHLAAARPGQREHAAVAAAVIGELEVAAVARRVLHDRVVGRIGVADERPGERGRVEIVGQRAEAVVGAGAAGAQLEQEGAQVVGQGHAGPTLERIERGPGQRRRERPLVARGPEQLRVLVQRAQRRQPFPDVARPSLDPWGPRVTTSAARGRHLAAVVCPRDRTRSARAAGARGYGTGATCRPSARVSARYCCLPHDTTATSRASGGGRTNTGSTPVRQIAIAPAACWA